jgi:hypothetical protein
MTTNLIDIQKKILDVKYGRVKEGLKLDIDEIDEFIRFKPANFNVIIGHANVGKTTVILYLMTLYTIKHNVKWLIFSSENTDYSMARKILEFKKGKPIQKMTDDEIEYGLAWVFQNFRIINVDKVYTYKTLMAEAKEIKQTFDYKGFLIDPYNSLAKDKELIKSVGSHEYDYEVSSDMRLFCKENDVSIWLNTHAVTEALRRVHPKYEDKKEQHKFSGLPIPPNMADVEGGGKWGNRADDVITIHRYTQHSLDWMYSELHVRKVKEVETGGRPTPIDNPIRLRMKQDNVGFLLNGEDIIINESVNKINLSPF